MKRSVALFLLVFATMHSIGASFTMNERYSAAYNDILRLKFESARVIMEEERSASRDNLAYHYLYSYIDFLKAIISEGKNDYQSLLNNKSTRISALEKISKDNPWRLYSIAQINLHTGVAALRAGEYFKAALEINRAYDNFTENDKRFPDFVPNKAGLGLLHILIGSIPDNFKWATNIIGLEGSVNDGLKELESTLSFSSSSAEYSYLYKESLFITTFVAFNVAENNTAIITLLNKQFEDATTREEIKNNPLLIYAVAAYYSHKGQNDAALKHLLSRPDDNAYYPFYYLDYITGVALLNKLDNSSRKYLFRYITNYKGKSYIKSAYQRLAWSYLIANDTNNYKTYISRVGIFGNNEAEADKEAMNEFRNKGVPNSDLMKIRLLFDGGYYNNAEEVLKEMNVISLSLNEKVEYRYRLARVQHRKGNVQMAKHNYLQTYQLGKNLTSYYAANSLLNLGQIYESENLMEEALRCYRICLQLPFKEYKSSITQKAKAGINRLTTRK